MNKHGDQTAASNIGGYFTSLWVLGKHTQSHRNLYSTVMLGQEYPYRFYYWIQSFVENGMGNSTTQARRARVRSGESSRLPLMWFGFKSRRRRHLWVEFVVSSPPCFERFFCGYSGYSPQKPTLPNSNSIWNAGTRFNDFFNNS